MNIETLGMLAGLMNFAAYSTGLPTPNTLPVIEFASRCEINRIHYGTDECGKGNIYAAALFLRDEGKIIFSEEDIDLNTLLGKSVAVHELVHWVQQIALLEGNVIMVDLINSTCTKAAYEIPAYRAQFEWIRENRRDPWMETPVTWGSLFQATTCRPVYELGG